ncbi:hypothetical protein NCCP2050_03030 [Planococcus sp. NCCP-2050]|nr:hypothetical protein NCCP2050_03030 [Planococcus sp. NCCP-2050]
MAIPLRLIKLLNLKIRLKDFEFLASRRGIINRQKAIRMLMAFCIDYLSINLKSILLFVVSK